MVEFTPEQQAVVDELVGKARTKAREKATAEQEAITAKAKKDAETAALVENQKWQELAETSQERIKALEPLEQKVKAYEEMVVEMLKGEVKKYGDSAAKALNDLPGTTSAIEKLEWLKKNQELFQVSGDGVGTPGRPKTKQTNKADVEICKYPLKL
jgi:hypothetical protein